MSKCSSIILVLSLFLGSITANVQAKYIYPYELTPLMLAAIRGDLETIKKLVADGADIEEKDEINWTALMHGCDHLEVVEFLVSKGASVNVKSVAHVTALDIAEGWEADEVYAFLEKNGAKHCTREFQLDDDNYDTSHCYEW